MNYEPADTDDADQFAPPLNCQSASTEGAYQTAQMHRSVPIQLSLL